MGNIDRAIIEFHQDGFSVPEIAELVKCDEATVVMSIQMQSVRAANKADIKTKFKEHQDIIFQTIMDMMEDPETDVGTRAKLAIYGADVAMERKGASKDKKTINVITINKHINQAREAYANQMKQAMESAPIPLEDHHIVDVPDTDEGARPIRKEAVKEARQKYIEKEHKHLMTIPDGD